MWLAANAAGAVRESCPFASMAAKMVIESGLRNVVTASPDLPDRLARPVRRHDNEGIWHDLHIREARPAQIGGQLDAGYPRRR
jgi:hypothetical protein